MNFNTALLHGNFTVDKKSGATTTPIYQSTAFRHDTAEELENIFRIYWPAKKQDGTVSKRMRTIRREMINTTLNMLIHAIETEMSRLISEILLKRVRHMSIKISQQTCIGCGKCLKVCPGDLIHRNEAGKPFVRAPQECWGSTSCLKECATGAIKNYLGADLGGRGGYLYTERDSERLHWVICKAGGEKVRISINQKDANHY